jgi:hypothetical protein
MLEWVGMPSTSAYERLRGRSRPGQERGKHLMRPLSSRTPSRWQPRPQSVLCERALSNSRAQSKRRESGTAGEAATSWVSARLSAARVRATPGRVSGGSCGPTAWSSGLHPLPPSRLRAALDRPGTIRRSRARQGRSARTPSRERARLGNREARRSRARQGRSKRYGRNGSERIGKKSKLNSRTGTAGLAHDFGAVPPHQPSATDLNERARHRDQTRTSPDVTEG